MFDTTGSATSPVHSYNEWDPLEEVILGTSRFAQLPTVKDRSLRAVNYSAYDEEYFLSAPAGRYPEAVLEEAEEDLDHFAEQLSGMGIVVRRPEPFDTARTFGTPHWQADGHYFYCPRDSVLVVGDELIETPMPMRHRYFENDAYHRLFLSYLRKGARWCVAPKGPLADDLYSFTNPQDTALTESEPAFDAANVLRCGRDLFFLISNTGNKLGALWLQSHLGREFRVHLVENVYSQVHLDTTLLPLRAGLVLANPARVNSGNLCPPFRKWEVLYAPEPVAVPCLPHWAPATNWIGMNLLSLSPTLVVVESRQLPLIRVLERRGFDVLPVRLRHCRTLSGGPHCVTLDIRRRGELEDYF